MPDAILVTYATRTGSTAGVAQRIADALRRQGESVSLRPFDDVDGLEGYKAVVLGSAIRGGKWLPEATKFVEDYRYSLSKRPTAYFEVCMTLRDDTPQNRAVVRDYFEAVLNKFPEIKPVSFGMFAGRLNLAKLSFFRRAMFQVFRSPQGDWRDWKAIDEWAGDLPPLLNAPPQTL